MKHNFIITLLLSINSFNTFSQTKQLSPIGQTPGGGGYHVNWDSAGQRLIVGCGTSVWIYDCRNTKNIYPIAKRPLLGLINETELYHDTLFVAATHDGVYALDISTEQLNVLAHYTMQGDSGAYDMWRTNDTLYIADSKKVRMLKYSNSSFTNLTTFGLPGAFCVTRRGNNIAVGSQGIPKGTIAVYDIGNLTTPIATWQHNKIWDVQDIQYADRRDDIIYVCGGPENILFTQSDFFALQHTGNNIAALDSFAVNGIILYGQANINNMDSRNDTIFLSTTGAFNTKLETMVPVLDATGLPNDSLKYLGYIRPGLWHFDVALMDGTPYIAMSSEWLGVLISDISKLRSDDTLGFLETGGWCVNTKIRGDTLWVCHEGYGIAAYKVDSLFYKNGFMIDSKIMHIFTQFVSDFDFIDDSLMILSTSEIFNLKPWRAGGKPEKVADMKLSWMGSMNVCRTNKGTRIVCGYDNPIGQPKRLLLYDPYDAQNKYPQLKVETTQNYVMGILVCGDTIFYGKKFGNQFYLTIAKIIDDNFVLIDTIASPGEILSISRDGDIVAIAYKTNLAWYRMSNGKLTQLGSYFNWFLNARDVSIKNNLLYVADQFFGMRVYDISQLNKAVPVAECKGTGGYMNVFGSNAVDVGQDGKIYLSDFNAGVIIIEPYESVPVSVHEKNFLSSEKNFVKVYPNPSSSSVTIELQNQTDKIGSLMVYNVLGQIIFNQENVKSNSLTLNADGLQTGIYFIRICNEDGRITFGKIMIREG